MPLTPIDIQQKTFGPELRGYNMDEVDDFLDEVVTALKDYDQRVRDAQDRIRALEAELSTRGEDESAISRALVAAQKQADALVSDAQVDADRIRADAQVEADRIRADREAERMTLTQDIARMRASVADLKRRVAELAASAGADLDEMDQAAAAASMEVAGEIPSPTAESMIGYDEAAIGDGLDVFGPAEGPEDIVDDSAEDIDEEPAPGEEPVEAAVGEELDLTAEEAELEEEAEEEQDEEERPGGDLAETEEELSEPPVGRRPWERGSV